MNQNYVVLSYTHARTAIYETLYTNYEVSNVFKIGPVEDFTFPQKNVSLCVFLSNLSL
jgi:hypothetical protein